VYKNITRDDILRSIKSQYGDLDLLPQNSIASYIFVYRSYTKFYLK